MFGNAFFFSSSSYLFDSLPTAKGVFALRKLVRGYSSYAVRVRRASDNATQDFTFVNNVVDTASIKAFCGVGNLVIRSQEFGASPWVSNSTTTTSDTTLAPDGTTTADTINSLGGTSYLAQGPTIPPLKGMPITYSLYVKQGTNRYAWLVFGTNSGATSNYGALFDLQTGTVITSNSSNVSNVSASITASTNGFYRVSVTATLSLPLLYHHFTSTNNTSPTFSTAGDITNATGGTIVVWGAQLELGTAPKTYLPTTNVMIENIGYIVTCYDQSGNINDVTQATASFQPIICYAGECITDGGKPAMLYQAGNPFLAKITPNISYTKHYVGAVVMLFDQLGRDVIGTNGTSTGNILLMNYNVSNATRGHYWASSTTAVIDYTPFPTTFGAGHVLAQQGTGSSFNVIRNGTPYGTPATYSGTTAAASQFIIGGRTGGNFYGYVKEVIVFDTDLTTTQQNTLERDQGQNFGITVA